MKVFLFAAAVSLVSVTAAGVSAATIDFTPYNPWQQGPLSFTNGTETVVASAGNAAPDGTILSGQSPLIRNTSSGIGICNGVISGAGAGGCFGDDFLTDGQDNNEVVLFDFGPLSVRIDSIRLSYVGDGDRFSVFGYGNGAGASPTESATGLSLINGNWSQAYSGLSLGVGSVFGIGAFGDTDNFLIRRIEFTVVNESLSQVPLPAAGWLMVAGLGGLLGLARRRKG